MNNQNETQETVHEFEEHDIPKTAVFIPCCDRKNVLERFKGMPIGLTNNDLPNTWNDLVAGRQAMIQCIHHPEDDSISAINLYNGKFYKAVDGAWNNVIKQMNEGWLRVFVISGCYGIIDIRELIQDYDTQMKKGRQPGCKHGATQWKQHEIEEQHGLENIICDLLLKLRPKRVFGYFCGKPEWKINDDKSRYFFEAGLKCALNHDLNPKCAGCFYRKAGRGLPALSCLGEVFAEHSYKEFECQYALNIINNPYRCNDVVISYNEIARHQDYQENLHLLREA